MEKTTDLIKQEFHTLNNYLNKITVQSGHAKYKLEKDGFNLDNLEGQKESLVKLLGNLEKYALEMGQSIQGLYKNFTNLTHG